MGTLVHLLMFGIVLVNIYHQILYLLSMPLAHHWTWIPNFFVCDLLSGFVHWFLDSYQPKAYQGDNKLKKWLINDVISVPFKDFAEHHVKPTKMVDEKSILENIWDSHLLSILFFSYLYIMHPSFLEEPTSIISFHVTLSILAVQINVSHRLAHSKNGKFISFLQKSGLLLSKEKHSLHHIKPEFNSYTIFNGSLNSILDKIEFWRTLESIIFSIFGVKSYYMDYKMQT